MIKITSKTLDEALYQASVKLECSVSELHYEVVQYERKGFLGLGRRDAIVIASVKTTIIASPNPPIEEMKEGKVAHEKSRVGEKVASKEKKQFSVRKSEEKKESETPKSTLKPARDEREQKRRISEIVKTDGVIDNFNRDIDEIAVEIENELNRIFAYSCFQLEKIKAMAYDKQTIYIEFAGDDAALLIGKEGYRYKALSYMLFNWINSKYNNIMIRLEIAEFLRNQEEMIRNYLVPIIDYIKKNGKGQTKPLDGVLAHIALKELREIFPNKYVSFRSTHEGEKFIVVNDFLTSQEHA